MRKMAKGETDVYTLEIFLWLVYLKGGKLTNQRMDCPKNALIVYDKCAILVEFLVS